MTVQRETQERVGWGQRLRAAWWYVRKLEPARLRAAWAAVVAALAATGIAVSADLDGKVQLAITLLGILVPLLAGEATRRQVVPKVRHDAQVAEARYQPPPM